MSKRNRNIVTANKPSDSPGAGYRAIYHWADLRTSGKYSDLLPGYTWNNCILLSMLTLVELMAIAV
jgi:hypothetical protein